MVIGRISGHGSGDATRSARRALALIPAALVVLGVSALSACSVTSTATYRAHGVSFSYPGGWHQETFTSSAAPNKLWNYAFGLGDAADLINVEAYRLRIPVGPKNLAAVAPLLLTAVQRRYEQAGGTVQPGARQVRMAGLPGLMVRATATEGGIPITSMLVYVFDGRTEYHVNCQHTQAKASAVQAACREVLNTFTVHKKA